MDNKNYGVMRLESGNYDVMVEGVSIARAVPGNLISYANASRKIMRMVPYTLTAERARRLVNILFGTMTPEQRKEYEDAVSQSNKIDSDLEMMLKLF